MKLIARYMKTALLLIFPAFLLAGCAGAPPRIDLPSTPPPPLTLKKRPDVAIVLGAGGARGYAHIGVLQVLHNAGVPINLITSASAGSVIGAFYADSGNPEKVAKIMLNATFWDFADLGNAPNFKGIIEGYHFQKFLLKNMRARDFNQLKIPLVVATTDLRTGKTYAISSGPVPPAALASAAIPGVVRPVHLYGHILIDGGMADPVPVNLALKYNPKVIIAINITQSLPKRLPGDAFGIYDRGYSISWDRLAQLSERGANIVIHPNVGDIGTLDIDAKYKMYRAGIAAAKKALPRILKLLREKHIPLTH